MPLEAAPPFSRASRGGPCDASDMRDAVRSTVDLNLLVVLVEVLEAGSVKAAARRLSITPSAVSHALARLRKVVEDPLVVRTTDGMQATPRAIALVEAARPALDQLERALHATADFDPARLQTTFTLSSASFGTMLFGPGLLSRLALAAPQVRLRFAPLPAVPEEGLARDLDAMIGVLRPDSPPGLYRRRLSTERWVCLVRNEHPHRGARMSLAEYARQRHIVIAPRGRLGGPIDQYLEAAGLVRRVACLVDDFLSAPSLVAETDLVLTGGDRFLRAACRNLPVRVVELEAALPTFDLVLVWHERVHTVPAQRWLRELLVAVSQEVYLPATSG